PAVALRVRLAVHADRRGVCDVSRAQRTVAPRAVATPRDRRRLADGAPLLSVQAEARAARGLQSAAEARVHVDDALRRAGRWHRTAACEAGAVRRGRQAPGRFLGNPDLSLRRDG